MPKKTTVNKEETLEVETPKEETTEPDEILDDISPEPKVKQEEEPTPPATTPADGTLIIEVKPAGGKAEIMRRKLASQPKVPIFIPLQGNEPFGSTYPMILNGYRLNIKKGMYVHVPKQVAEVYMASQQQTVEAINNYFLMNEQGISQAMREHGTA